jgi:hypothetical protein
VDDPVNAEDLSAGQLGRTISFRHEADSRVNVARWALRGELVQVTHRLGGAGGSPGQRSTVVTLLVGESREEIMFTVHPDDVVDVHPAAAP